MPPAIFQKNVFNHKSKSCFLKFQKRAENLHFSIVWAAFHLHHGHTSLLWSFLGELKWMQIYYVWNSQNEDWIKLPSWQWSECGWYSLQETAVQQCVVCLHRETSGCCEPASSRPLLHWPITRGHCEPRPVLQAMLERNTGAMACPLLLRWHWARTNCPSEKANRWIHLFSAPLSQGQAVLSLSCL